MHRHIIERKIMWGDIDALGIVFYPRYYEWIDACAHLFFESIGLRLDELWEKRRIQFGLVETSSRYHAPGRYHQSIRMVTRIEKLTSKTVAFKHTITRSSDDVLMLTANETRICMGVADPTNIHAVDIPEDIYTVLKNAMGLTDSHSSSVSTDDR